MASIERTAYPRFKRQVSARELRDVYTASPDEIDWARGLTRSDEHLLALTVLLKCFQRLGYFPRLEEVPRAVVKQVRDGLGLAEEVPVSRDADRTTRYHKGLVRDRLGVTAEPERARTIAEEAIRSAAAVKDNPADLINVALEELIRARCELPAYSTLDRLAGRIRAEVNGTIFELVHRRISPTGRARLLSLLERDPITRRSGFDLLKQPAPAATLSRFRQHLELMGWLDVLGATDAWLSGVPASKVSHFAGEAGVLDASELGDVGEVKRIVLVACLLHQARVRARDDLAEMFCKRMAGIHKKGRELLAQIQERQRERSERMISVFGDVLAVAREARTVETSDDWRLRFGIEAATVLENAGGLEELATEHEELSAHHGNNYLPLLDRFYRGHRALLRRRRRRRDARRCDQPGRRDDGARPPPHLWHHARPGRRRPGPGRRAEGTRPPGDDPGLHPTYCGRSGEGPGPTARRSLSAAHCRFYTYLGHTRDVPAYLERRTHA